MKVILAVLAALALAAPANAEIGAGSRPNILVVLTDDQDYSTETLAKMPYLSTRTGWYRFSAAFANNATCCPSRATLLTGQWSHHHGVGDVPSEDFDDSDTIATRLHDAGYETGWFGKYHLGPDDPTYVPPGWDEFVDQLADTPPYYDYTLNDNGTLVTHGHDPADYSTDVLAAKTLDFIDQADQPFFAVYAPRAPHGNWIAAPRDLGYYATAPVPFPPSWNENTADKPAWWAARPQANANNRTGAMRKEWDTLLAVDDAVKALHQRIQALGLMSNTLIVYTTDNGFAFGEHRWSDKRCVYDSCSRLPLMVKYGSHAEGTTFGALVGNEDWAPTFAELAGVAPPPTDGQSMVSMLRTKQTPPLWENEVLLREANADEPGVPPDAWAIRTPQFMYAETSTGERELYDLTADPYEINNVAGQPAYLATQLALATRLSLLKARTP